MKTLMVMCLSWLAQTGATQSVAAEPSEALRRAKTHYETGTAQYRLGNYADAAHEYLAGYDLTQRAEFLINAGQAYRRLGDLERARQMFTQYMTESRADATPRSWVARHLADIEAQLAVQAEKAAPPVTPQEKVAALVVPEPQPVTAPLSIKLPPPPKKSFIRRHWWIIPVSAAVIAGIGVGVYFGTRSGGGCEHAALGCFDTSSALR